MNDVTQEEVTEAARRVAEQIQKEFSASPALWGVARGGVPAVYAVASALLEQGCTPRIVDVPEEAEIAVDDLVDSGRTRERVVGRWPHLAFYALFHHPSSWLVFPWEQGERDTSAEDVGLRFLQAIGEQPDRQGLQDTPKRWMNAWRDTWASGYDQDPASVLKVFQDGAEDVDELVLVRDIPVWSHCEHHLAPFFGVAHVGYIPDGRVVGLSKLKRLVDIFARRLQVQERLTRQVADAMNEHLRPLGAGVVMECRHTCMESRGIQTSGSATVTSAMHGALRKDPAARQEFMDLVNSRLGRPL